MMSKDCIKLSKSIWHARKTDSYVVNLGANKVFAFPNREDAERFLKDINETRYQHKVVRFKVMMAEKDEKLLAKIKPWPINLMERHDLDCDPSVAEASIDCGNLTERERECARRHLVEGEPLRSIAQTQGVTYERIGQIVAKAERKMVWWIREYPKREQAIARRNEEAQFRERLLEQRERMIQTLKETGNIPEEAYKAFGIENRREAPEMGIEDIELSVRSYNCLRRAGIASLKDLTSKTEDEMMKVRNLGKKSLKEIKDKLSEYGLGFREKTE